MKKKYTRAALTVTAQQYEVNQGLEDGFELFADVVTKGWIVTDTLIKVTREDGSIVCPYIKHRRGRTFIGEGDYVVIDEDGTKHVCGSDKIFERYEKIGE